MWVLLNKDQETTVTTQWFHVFVGGRRVRMTPTPRWQEEGLNTHQRGASVFSLQSLGWAPGGKRTWTCYGTYEDWQRL